MTKPHTTVADRMSGVRESWLALTNEEIIAHLLLDLAASCG